MNNDEYVDVMPQPALDSLLVHLRCKRGSVFFAIFEGFYFEFSVGRERAKITVFRNGQMMSKQPTATLRTRSSYSEGLRNESDKKVSSALQSRCAQNHVGFPSLLGVLFCTGLDTTGGLTSVDSLFS